MIENGDGIHYFLSLQILTTPEKKTIGRSVISETTGAIEAIDAVKPLQLVKKVDPIYPEETRKAGVEGIVILEVGTENQPLSMSNQEESFL